MKSTLLLGTLAFALSAAPAFAQGTASANQADTAVLKYLMQDSVGEIQQCQLAQQKSSNSAVKSLATRLSDDHKRMITQLESQAKQMGVTLQEQPSDEAQIELAHLSRYSGQQFDEAFLRGQLQDHRNDVDTVRHAMEATTNAAMKTFDDQALKTLESHIGLVNATMDQVEGGASGANRGR